MSLLMDLTVRGFSDVLASNEPAPGGGSAAALAGVLGASLSIMVVNLTVGKKAYESLQEDIKVNILNDFKVLQRLKSELTDLVDEDTKAFSLFFEAQKMPKDSENEKSRREVAMTKAGIYALEVPLSVAEKCLSILKHQIIIAKYGNKNAISDIGVGSLLALTGLEGAVLNVKINLPGINDDGIRKDALEKIGGYVSEGYALKSEIMEVVNTRMV